jgi:hypothetical protein
MIFTDNGTQAAAATGYLFPATPGMVAADEGWP